MDPLLITAQVVLSALGVLGVAASAPEAWPTQALRATAGLAIVLVIARVPPRSIIKASPYLYVAVLAMLAAVLVIGASPEGSESRRWILIGNFSLQPSELMKVTVVAYLTAFFYNHLGNWQLWRPMLVIGLAAGLIVAQPDISTALFIFLLAIAIMLAAGTTLARLLSIGTASVLIAVLIAGPYLTQYSYLADRLIGFVDLMGPQEHTQTIGFQATQAQRTLVRSGLFGVGTGIPMSVPEADTDMIAVSVAHALGFLGVAILFLLFLLIAGRGIRIAASLKGPGALLAAGATTYICAQAALNLLVSAGLIPVTGVPLPFVSFGLNSLISVSIAMGFIHGAYRQARAEGAPL